MFAGVVFLFVTVTVGKVTDGYVWMKGWMAWHGVGGEGRLDILGKARWGVIGIMSSSLFLRLR